MKYFRIWHDKRIPYAAMLTNLNSITGYYEYKKGSAYSLDDSFVSQVSPSPVNFYPDILDRQIFMVKGAAKDVLDIFAPDIAYKTCCVIDEVNGVYEQYYIPLLDTLDIQMGMMPGRHVFRAAGSSEVEVLASLELAEALLRRGAVGCRASFTTST